MSNEVKGPPPLKKQRMPKPLRHALTSATVLLVIIVLGGIAYTYIVGQSDTQTVAATAPPEAPAEPVIKPSQPSPNAKESAAVEALTSPVAPGENASVTIKTNPTSNCTISVMYNNVASTDSGLVAKAADSYGTVTWTWTVGTNVPVGTWPVKVTCAYHTQTAVVQGDLLVQK